MAKYSKKASEKIGETMHEFKEGKLKSSSGDKVTSRKQAVAIGISEAKQEGDRVPPVKKTATKKEAPKKAAAKKASPKKANAQKATTKK